jgi:hypothetical protein
VALAIANGAQICPLRVALARRIVSTERDGARSAVLARSCVPDRHFGGQAQPMTCG